VKDWNRGVIDEFRANAGKVGGLMEGRPLLLLHHRGAKTGQERVNPVVYLSEGENFVIFASKSGHPTNPDWYHNLVANPDATIEVGTETLSVRARVPERDERDRYWKEIKERIAGFAEYENKTDRVIPAVVLERV
jgi:deazaflavin-dependent oxidoreductase (nitroreductase family)